MLIVCPQSTIRRVAIVTARALSLLSQGSAAIAEDEIKNRRVIIKIDFFMV